MLASRFWPRRGFRPTFLRRLPLDPVVPRVPLLYGSRLVVVDARRRRGRARAAPAARASRSPTSAPPSATRCASRSPASRSRRSSRAAAARRSSSSRPRCRSPARARDPRQARARRRLGRARAARRPDRAADASSSPAGLARRPGRRAIESLVTPEFALRFRGEVVGARRRGPERSSTLGAHGEMPLRVNRALAETRRGRRGRRRRDRAPRRPGVAARRGVGATRSARRRRESLLETARRAGLGAGARARARARSGACR